jgi:hypothetical protein
MKGWEVESRMWTYKKNSTRMTLASKKKTAVATSAGSRFDKCCPVMASGVLSSALDRMFATAWAIPSVLVVLPVTPCSPDSDPKPSEPAV